MNDTPDHELLRRYADLGAEEAFTELVKRHIDLVWAAAWRVGGDRELARDVAQTVFTDLARKARKLPHGTVLPGWLYRAACYAASMHIRGEARRAQRERQAMHDNELRSASDAAETRAAAELQPVLDAALGELPEADRDAVVLRFLAGRSLAEVGATLGTNEDAAQKRVGRALEKLRDAFRKRGVTVGGGIVAAALGAAGTQAAPAGMAAAVAAGALVGAGATAGAASFFLLMKTKLVLGIVAGAVVATALAWQQRSVRQLSEENAALRQQVAALPAALATRPAVTSSADQTELARLREQHLELLRLRGEVARLHQAAPSAGTDLLKRLQGAESRADEAEATAELMKAMEVARKHSAKVVNAMKNLGLAARVFATDNKYRFPTTFEEMRNEMNLQSDGTFSGGMSPDLFEFFPHERVISEAEPERLLFREKQARSMPDGKQERISTYADGSVQRRQTPDGDFTQFEREGTGTAANAPKKP